MDLEVCWKWWVWDDDEKYQCR